MVAIDERPLDRVGHGELLRPMLVGWQASGDASAGAEDGGRGEGQGEQGPEARGQRTRRNYDAAGRFESIRTIDYTAQSVAA